MIKAVIFDMFETLVSLFTGSTYFSEHIAADLNLSQEEFRKAWHTTEDDRTCGRYTIEEAAQITLKLMGRESEESAKLVADKRMKNLEGIFERMPKESAELLKTLKKMGLKTGLISNCFSDEAQVIQESVLYPLFDVTVLSYDVGIRKPDPEIFKRAVDMLGVKAEECLYVGDGGSKELFAARDAGMKTLQARYFSHLAYEPHIPCGELEGFDHAYSMEDILKFVQYTG